MKDVKKIEEWRAEEIAKVYLLNSGLVTLLPNYNDKFDFLAISKENPDKKIAIDVKATKYSRSEIEKQLLKTKKNITLNGLPVLLMFINYDKENGFFEVLKQNEVNELQPIKTDIFNKKIKELVK